jgi:hypothetical protein
LTRVPVFTLGAENNGQHTFCFEILPVSLRLLPEILFSPLLGRRRVYYSNPSVVVLQHVLVDTLQLLYLLVGSLSDRSVSREASPRGRTLSVAEATDHPAVAVRVTQMWG